MSTLSELLPAGSGGKNVDFVASGTLASGQTVGLKTDGTVEAISEAAEGLGAQTTFLAAVTDNYTCVYDSTADRFVLIYRTNSDFYYYGVVGERSGSTITFGTPQAVNTINQNNDARAVYDPTANRVLVFQNNPSGYGGGVAVTPATVTAGSNSISFATGQNFLASLSCTPKAVCYDPVHLKTFLLWRNGSASNYGYGSVFNAANPSAISIDSNSGTDITGNNSMDTKHGGDCAFDTQRSRIAIVYQSPSSAWLRTSSVTISSGSPSVTGMHQIDNTRYWNECHLAFDSSINRFLIIARSTTNVGYGWVAEMDASGTMTATSALTTFPNSGTNNQGQYSSVSSNNAGKWLVVSRNTNTGAIGSYYVVTDYLLAPVFSNATNALTSGSGNVIDSSIAFDGSRFLFMMQAQTTSLSVGRVFNFLSNNVSSFIGITDAAIADTATGSVTIKGGIGIAQAVGSGSIGTEVVYGSAGSNLYTGATFDSSNNRVVIVYRDGANSNHGTAVVGNVSGTSISFGTPVTYNTSGSTDPNAVGFDSNSNKVVVAYRDGGDSDKGKAIVGTVDPSDNSIDFPSSEVEFNGGNTGYINVVFDSSNNRIVITYTDYGNNSAATAIAGTVSGNTISFGSEVVINSNGSYFTASTFDSTANKVVIAYQDAGNSNYGTANVLTVDPSDNSITFGADSVFNQATTSTGFGPTSFGIAFDSTNNRTVIAYSDEGSSSHGYASVGTISGTAITFGTKVEFYDGVIYGVATVFDPSSNKIVISYSDSDNSYYGNYILGTVSNTSISFNTAQIFASATTQYIQSAVDTNSNRVVNAYADTQGPTANNGTAIVIQPAGQSENLTPNSVYYVQTNGDINTTSTSPAVRLGKALSSTSINLEFNS